MTRFLTGLAVLAAAMSARAAELPAAPVATVAGRAVAPYEVTLSAGPINKIFDGRQREKGQTKRGWVVSFDLEQPGELALSWPDGAPDDVEIRPYGRAGGCFRRGESLVVPIQGPERFVVTSPSGRAEDVHVFANPPFRAPEGANVRRFARGEHRPGLLSPESNETIVLDEGAVVHAEVFVFDATNVTICGRGVFDFSEWERSDARARAFREAHGLPSEDTEFACNPFVVYGSSRVRIEGVTLKDAPFWTLIVRNGSRDVELDNVKIVGNWRYNSDGINVQASSRVRVRDCFVRSFDDCLVVRAPYMAGDDGLVMRDISFERNVLWCDWGKNCEVWAGHKDALIENVAFRANAFANVHFTGCDVTTWFCSGSTYIGDVVFEDNEYDFARPRWKTVFQTADGQKFNLEEETEANLLSVDAWSPAKNLGNQHFGPADDVSKYRLLYDGIRFSRPRIYGSNYSNLTVKSETSTPYQRIRNLVAEDLPANVEVLRRGNTDLSVATSRGGRLAALWASNDRSHVFIASHRMDWRRHPENSLSALEGAIAAGAEILEVDVKRTKDGVFVVSHDKTVNRCTDGSGRIGDMTLAEIRALRLRMGQGGAGAELTNERMPTLAEVLRAAKGRALVNLDQSQRQDLRALIDLVVREGCLAETIFKGNFEPEAMRRLVGETYWRWLCEGKICYMPVTKVAREDDVARKRAWEASEAAPRAHELVLGAQGCEAPLLTETFLRPDAPRLWINTLWDSLARGHTDDRSLTRPEDGWGWAVDQGASVIQTDRPRQLKAYLEGRGRQ